MHRRCLSLAHNADFEDIADPAVRAPLEARNLLMGAELIHEADRLTDASAVCAIARDFNGKDVL
jgi:5-methylthioribose kinase